MPDNTFYPPVSFSFSLAFTGIEDDIDVGFQEASGISMERGVEEVEVSSGGENRFKYKLPGVNKYSNLVLKRGLVPTSSALATWVQSVLQSGLSTPIKTKTITVSLLDSEGNKLISWNFIDAYPVKWNVSDFKSMENAYAVETLEFAYSSFKKN